ALGVPASAPANRLPLAMLTEYSETSLIAAPASFLTLTSPCEWTLTSPLSWRKSPRSTDWRPEPRSFVFQGMNGTVAVAVATGVESGTDPCTDTASDVPSVTWTVQVPSAPVRHEEPPRKVALPPATNWTVAPCAATPPWVTVAVTVAGSELWT